MIPTAASICAPRRRCCHGPCSTASRACTPRCRRCCTCLSWPFSSATGLEGMGLGTLLAWAPGRLRAMDADRVLAAPHRLSLRARGRPRGQAALADPRRAPRAPQRSQPPRDAALARRSPWRRSSWSATAWSSARRRGWRCRTGFLVGYVVYDTMHWYLHHRIPRSRMGGACASCTCAITSRTTPAASGSARPTGTASSTPRRSPAARRRVAARRASRGQDDEAASDQLADRALERRDVGGGDALGRVAVSAPDGLQQQR